MDVFSFIWWTIRGSNEWMKAENAEKGSVSASLRVGGTQKGRQIWVAALRWDII